MTLDIELLDTLVPLRGASFRDVVGAGVDLPLRYSEFFVYLNDGTKARPRNPGQLLGYGMRGDHVNFYFRSGAEVVGIGVVAERQRPILAVEYWGPLKACRALSHRDPAVGRLGRCVRLTAPDGSLLFIALPEFAADSDARPSRRTPAIAGLRAIRANESTQHWLGR